MAIAVAVAVAVVAIVVVVVAAVVAVFAVAHRSVGRLVQVSIWCSRRPRILSTLSIERCGFALLSRQTLSGPLLHPPGIS